MLRRCLYIRGSPGHNARRGRPPPHNFRMTPIVCNEPTVTGFPVGKKITGVLLHCSDGRRARVGSVRLDLAGTPLDVQDRLEFFLGYRLSKQRNGRSRLGLSWRFRRAAPGWSGARCRWRASSSGGSRRGCAGVMARRGRDRFRSRDL